jgi:hypothetical protein
MVAVSELESYVISENENKAICTPGVDENPGIAA